LPLFANVNYTAQHWIKDTQKVTHIPWWTE